MQDRAARATMLIRVSIAEVFDAFVRPEKLTRFWLEAASAPLAKDARVTWRFMVPGATETVTVTDFAAPGRIAFDWSDGRGSRFSRAWTWRHASHRGGDRFQRRHGNRRDRRCHGRLQHRPVRSQDAVGDRPLGASCPGQSRADHSIAGWTREWRLTRLFPGPDLVSTCD